MSQNLSFSRVRAPTIRKGLAEPSIRTPNVPGFSRQRLQGPSKGGFLQISRERERESAREGGLSSTSGVQVNLLPPATSAAAAAAQETPLQNREPTTTHSTSFWRSPWKPPPNPSGYPPPLLFSLSRKRGTDEDVARQTRGESWHRPPAVAATGEREARHGKSKTAGRGTECQDDQVSPAWEGGGGLKGVQKNMRVQGGDCVEGTERKRKGRG